jgi:hypothetical protein
MALMQVAAVSASRPSKFSLSNALANARNAAMPESWQSRLKLAADIGGTFTDIVLEHGPGAGAARC